MAFWRRKTNDRFITLGLNEPATTERREGTDASGAQLQPPAAQSPPPDTTAQTQPLLEPTTTGGAPTPPPAVEAGGTTPAVGVSADTARTVAPTRPPVSESTRERVEPSRSQTPPPRPVPSRSPFQ
ncbi:MAG: hypothetical protein ACJ741_08220, partial [Pyrinomonadaceae bacterium]